MKTQIELKLEIIDRIVAVHSQMRAVEKSNTDFNNDRYEKLKDLLNILETEFKNV